MVDIFALFLSRALRFVVEGWWGECEIVAVVMACLLDTFCLAKDCG